MTDYMRFRVGEFRLSDGCRFEHWHFSEDTNYVELCYTERSPDPWYSDSETELELSRDEALGLVRFLTKAYNLTEEELNGSDPNTT
jgi:hypothetical protein